MNARTMTQRERELRKRHRQLELQIAAGVIGQGTTPKPEWPTTPPRRSASGRIQYAMVDYGR